MSDIIRVGIIGAGYIAEQHLETIARHPQVEVAGIYSRTASTAEKLAGKFDSPAVFTSLDALVNEAKPDALMVMVSVENMYTVGKQALGFGLPVFMEKPAGLFPDQATELNDIAKANNIKTMVGYNRRHYSVFRKGLEVIKEHGELLGVLVEGHERMAQIHECDQFSDECLDGWIYANATHTIDLLRLFGGEVATMKSVSTRWEEACGDQFSASIEFEGGAIGTYVSNWLSPGGWRAVLYGKGVTVEFKPLEQGIWTDLKYETHEIKPDAIDEDFKPGFYGQLSDFHALVTTGELPASSLDLAGALKTMQLAQQLTESAKDRP